MDQLVKVGDIINTHGIRGELKISAVTDFPEERFAKGAQLYVRHQGRDIPVTVATHRVHKGYDLVSFEGMANINFVEQYKGGALYGEKDESLLGDDEYYVDDIIGCHVYNDGQYIGDVIDVYDNTAQELLCVKTGDKNVLIPQVDAFVKNRDIDNKRIDVSLIKGFLDDDED